MGTDTSIPDSHKAPQLLASMSSNSPLESTVVAQCTCDSDELMWEHVTADLIQEWIRLKGRVDTNNNCHNKIRNSHGSREAENKNHRDIKSRQAPSSVPVCGLCGKKGKKPINAS